MRGPGLESVQKGVGESEFLVLSCPLPGRDLSQKVTSLESTVEKREQALKTGEAEVPLCPSRRCEHAQCLEKCPDWAQAGCVSMRSVLRSAQTALCRPFELQELPGRCHSQSAILTSVFVFQICLI